MHRAIVATKVKEARAHLFGSVLDATSPLRMTLGRSTHRGTSVLDSLRYGLKTLGSGQVPLLSDILTDTAKGAQKKKTLTPVIAKVDRNKTLPQAHTCL